MPIVSIVLIGSGLSLIGLAGVIETCKAVKKNFDKKSNKNKVL